MDAYIVSWSEWGYTMNMTNNDSNNNRPSLYGMSIKFIAINLIIVSVLTFALTGIAVITNNYDKWFPLAIVISVVFFFIGRWLLKTPSTRAQ
ncbi:hypothetical protein PN836_012430 [Ningiella sp. W23]|uniref:hypothetical protein n=1 Tax=Ningiella sp. W23 TaxID=3023715 RepID=UPI003756F639